MLRIRKITSMESQSQAQLGKFKSHENLIIRKKQEKMAIMAKSVYLESYLVGIHRHPQYLIEFLSDTGRHPNLFKRAFLPGHWSVHRQEAGNVHLCPATKASTGVIGKIKLHVRIGNFFMQATFHIVEELVVNISCSQIHRREYSGLLPQSKKVTPHHSNPVP